MDKPGSQMRPYALKAEEGWVYRFGIDFTVKAGELRSEAGATFMEYITRKGEEPPVHTHPTEDEMFYVLEGSITFRCGQETFDLQKGGFVLLPRGIEHGYTINNDEPVRLIVVTSPMRVSPNGGWHGCADMESGQAELIAKPLIQIEKEELHFLK